MMLTASLKRHKLKAMQINSKLFLLKRLNSLPHALIERLPENHCMSTNATAICTTCLMKEMAAAVIRFLLGDFNQADMKK